VPSFHVSKVQRHKPPLGHVHFINLHSIPKRFEAQLSKLRQFHKHGSIVLSGSPQSITMGSKPSKSTEQGQPSLNEKPTATSKASKPSTRRSLKRASRRSKAAPSSDHDDSHPNLKEPWVCCYMKCGHCNKAGETCCIMCDTERRKLARQCPFGNCSSSGGHVRGWLFR